MTQTKLEENGRMLEGKVEKNGKDHLMQALYFKDVEIKTNNVNQQSKIIHLDIKASTWTHTFDFRNPTFLPNTTLPLFTEVCM